MSNLKNYIFRCRRKRYVADHRLAATRGMRG